MTAWVLVSAGGAAALFLIWHRLRAYLYCFQQDRYEPLRFLRGVTYRSLVDPAVWLAVVCRVIAGMGLERDWAPSEGIVFRDTYQIVGFGMTVSSPPSTREVVAAVLFIAGAVVLARLKPYPQRSDTTSLDLTGRSRRVLWVAIVLAFFKLAVGQIAAMILLRSSILEPYLFLALLFALLPLFVLFSNLLLGPYERGRQQMREIEARRNRSAT